MIPNVTVEYVGQILIVPILLRQIDTSISREYNTCEICGYKHEVFSSKHVVPKIHTDTTQVRTTEIVVSINYQHYSYTKSTRDSCDVEAKQKVKQKKATTGRAVHVRQYLERHK